jgi:hypothetical protein
MMPRFAPRFTAFALGAALLALPLALPQIAGADEAPDEEPIDVPKPAPMTQAQEREAAGPQRSSQLCRSFMNMGLAPFDIVLSPFIVAKDEYYGLTEVDDEPIIQIISAVPGYFWLNTVQAGGGVIRFISGIFELPGGVVALFTGNPSTPLYRSQDETWQIYDAEWGPCPFRFGSSYNTINEG